MGRRGRERKGRVGRLYSFITFPWLLNVWYELCTTANPISDTNKYFHHFSHHIHAHTHAHVIGNGAHNSWFGSFLKENTLKMADDLKPPLRMIIICFSQAIFTSTTESWYLTVCLVRCLLSLKEVFFQWSMPLGKTCRAVFLSQGSRGQNAWRKVLSANWKLSSSPCLVYLSPLCSLCYFVCSLQLKRTPLSIMYSHSQPLS